MSIGPTTASPAADRFQGFERVEHEIQHQLLQLNPIGEDGREIWVQHQIEGHVLARRVAVEQAKHLPNDLAEIELHFLDGRPFEQGAYSPNDLAGVLAVLDDPFCCLHGLGNVRRRRGQPSQAGVSVGHDGGERLIDFMRNGAVISPRLATRVTWASSACVLRSVSSVCFRSVMSSESAIKNRGMLAVPGTRETLLLTQIELPSLRRYCFSI